MKVTVVGSYKDKLSERRKEDKKMKAKSLKKFEKACRAIGKVIAQEEHRLVVAHGEKPETAEALALQGFQSEFKQKYKYYECIRHEGDADLKAHLDAVEMSDVVILIGGGNGTYASGLSALRRRKVMIPIPVFGGSAQDLCVFPEIDNIVVDKLRNLNLDDRNWEDILKKEIKSTLRSYPRVLIIHGRGDDGVELQDRIEHYSTNKKKNKNKKKLRGISKPVIMNLSGSGAVAVPKFFEDLASKVSAAIVIVTADDIGGFARIEGKKSVPATDLQLKVRARENVWVEVGWFWGRLGRERIFLWLKDEVEIPSDLQGVARTKKRTLKKAWPSIERFLFSMREKNDSYRR